MGASKLSQIMGLVETLHQSRMLEEIPSNDDIIRSGVFIEHQLQYAVLRSSVLALSTLTLDLM